MCYSIPGKIVEITDRLATIDYFGERRKAYIDLLDEARVGDYVYAQGGFLIRKVSEEEANEIFATWRELFFKLQEEDRRLAIGGLKGSLYQRANAIRQEHQGNSCCVHGIIEFSNYCRCNCLYCGIRRENKALQRYRMEVPEILKAVDDAVALGFQALVLQSGEDPYYDDDKLEEVVREIRARHPVLLFMSVGERSLNAYERMYKAGARGALLRFETSNPELYERLKPPSPLTLSPVGRGEGEGLNARLGLINALKDIGYLIVTGFLIGLPDQTTKDTMKDIKLTADLGAEMFSFGPLVPHPATPLAGTPRPTLKKTLDTIARARIMNPDAKILVTTALETLYGLDGAREALMAGANSLMINVTPPQYRKLYDIYPERFGTDMNIQDHIGMVIELLQSLGRAPTDLSV